MKIHIAGFPVRVGSKCRQRCAWCDHILIDDDLDLIMVAPAADGSSGHGPLFWKLGSLVAVEGNGKWTVKDDGERLPPQCCASQGPKLHVVGKDGS